MSKHLRLILAASISLFGLAIVLLYSFNPPAKEITRAQLQQMLKGDTLISAKVIPSSYAGIFSVEGIEQVDGKPKEFYITTRLEESEAKALFDKGAVKVEVPGHGMKAQLWNIVPTLVIALLVVGLMLYQLNVGKGRRKHKINTRPSTRFSDVAGVEEAKAEVQEIVDFLKHPKKYKALGGHLPKGILLVGPPGTGKTMLAKAIAGEAEAHFFSAHGSDFNEIYVGVGAKRIRELFRQAAKHKPAIIFIDEIDCLGKNRKTDSNAELQQTNNALLAAMDGFEGSEGIVVVAATNRPEDLDDALLRPGRFDRKVYVSLPDMRGRRAILAAHTKDRPVQDREKTLDVMAQTTTEMSGADLASVINEAAILCAQRSLTEIGRLELEESRDKVRWGKERKSFVLKKEEREMVAYHEAGHTIINLRKALLPPLYKVSIIPRGQALGVTTLLPDEDQHIHSKTFMLEELVVLMGGRAAEMTFYGATTNGASGDLASAKNIARKMIYDWGMGQKLYYEVDRGDAEKEINRLLEAADREALQMIHEEKDNTHKLAQALIKHETLTREQVMALLYEGRHPMSELKPALN